MQVYLLFGAFSSESRSINNSVQKRMNAVFKSVESAIFVIFGFFNSDEICVQDGRLDNFLAALTSCEQSCLLIPAIAALYEFLYKQKKEDIITKHQVSWPTFSSRHLSLKSVELVIQENFLSIYTKHVLGSKQAPPRHVRVG